MALPRSDTADPPAQRNAAAGRALPSGGRVRSPRQRIVRWALFALLGLALIAGAYFYVSGGQVMSTDDAYVEAEKVGISTDVSGIVGEVDVKENEHVETGHVLYRLDGQPFRLALQRAEAGIGIVADQLNAMKANYRDMQTQIRQADDDLAYFDREFQRQQYLKGEHVVSDQTLDTAHRNLENAQQKRASLEQQLAGIGAGLDGDPEGPIERNPRYLDAVAQRDEAARQLDHTIVKAPFAGVVTDVPSTAPGKYLPASTTAFFLVATDHVWIDSSPKETELTYVRPGHKATVTADTYPGIEWHGTVESISPAAAEEFSLLPAQNTSGNWVKVVQRIPMRVRVDTSDPDLPPLRAGMSVEVAVATGHTRGFPRFLTDLFGEAAPGR